MDVTCLIDYLLNGSAGQLNELRADVDKSGDIDINDLTILLDQLLSR